MANWVQRAASVIGIGLSLPKIARAQPVEAAAKKPGRHGETATGRHGEKHACVRFLQNDDEEWVSMKGLDTGLDFRILA
jgi:hypothetical protein